MESVTQKICVGCGKDVSTVKRVRDDAGRYFCQPCYTAAASKVVQPQSTSAPEVSPPPLSVRRSVPSPAPAIRQQDAPPDRRLPPSREANSAQTSRPYLKWLAYGAFAVVAAAVSFTVYFYKVIEPEQQRMQKVLVDNVAQVDKTAKMQQELTRRQDDLQERRDWAFASLQGPLKEEFVVKVTNNYKWTKTQAIQNDPVVSSVLKTLPDLDGPIRRWDTMEITDIFMKNRAADIAAGDQNCVRVFSHAIGGQRE